MSVVVTASGEGLEHARCLDSVSDRTGYPSFEAIVAEPHPRGVAAALNLGAAKAGGEYLVLLAGDAEIVERDWIELLLMHAEMPGVGPVGALAVHPDGRVRSAGIALGIEGTADHLMRGLPADGDGYYGSLSCAHEVGAVSAGCMLVRRSSFERLGGFREDYRTHYHDVDLCLRARREGLESVYAPRPRIVRHEPVPPGQRYDMTDRALLVDTWYEELRRGDPYYNPGFSRVDARYTLRPAGSVPTPGRRAPAVAR